MTSARLLAAALALAATTPALSQTHAGMSHGGMTNSAETQAAATTPATREYMAAHAKMMAAMHQPFTGDPDVDFRVQMIPHHQGAIDMARVALRHATDPWTRQLAEAIIVEQQREIYDMQGWLARRGVQPPAGGGRRHILGWNSYRVPSEPEAGTLDETTGQSWTAGSGIPKQR